MNIEELAESLKPWMQVDTWHTTHPLDHRRFHKALESAIAEHGRQISYGEFEQAMRLLVEQLYPAGQYEEAHLEENIDRFATNAQTIASYIYDTTQTD